MTNGRQGLILYEFDKTKPNDFKKFCKQLNLFLCDKGATIIHLDLDRGVDHLIKAFK